MSLAPYGRVLADTRLRLTLLLGVLVRIPAAAAGLIVTLHVVGMGRSYAQAGIATMAMTAGLAISGPWRGRLLDRLGLRRVVLPSLAVLTVCWLLAPHLDYAWLLLDCAVLGLFTIPAFSIIRQAIMIAVPGHDQRTALALDAVAVELSFMIGPLVGVWAATTWDTGVVLASVGLAGVVAGVLLWLADPPLRTIEESGPELGTIQGSPLVPSATGPDRWGWFSPAVGALFGAAAAMALILSGTDLGVVAATREFGATDRLGLVLALWCVGSVIGGLAYGAQRRQVSALWLLFGLGAVTLPAAWAADVVTLTLLVVLAGLLCAPTSTALMEQLGRLVPEEHRGEAMGWHGSFLHLGVATGAPLAGIAIDRGGFAAGFATVALVGMAMAIVGMGLTAVRRSARVARLVKSTTRAPGTIRS